MLYRIIASGMKIHFCTSYTLAQTVVDNLQKRHSIQDFTIETVTESEYHWDAGGMVYKAKKYFDFPLDSVTISCWQHHWEDFEARINNMSSSKYDDKFYKLHGQFHIFCFSPKEFDDLKLLVATRKDECDAQVSEL